MNSYSWKLESEENQQQGTRVSKRKASASVQMPEGLSSSALNDLREGQRMKPVDLNALKNKFESYNLGRRVAPRFSIEISVVIFAKNKSCRTHTVNVSESGLLIAAGLPQSFMNSELEIVMILEGSGRKEHALFKGRLVGTDAKSARLAFNESSEKASSLLSQALQDLTPLPWN